MKLNASRLVVVGLSVVIAIGVGVAAWWFDLDLPASDRERTAPIEDLVAPSPLSAQERAAVEARKGLGTNVQLDGGAWVQVAGKDGKVAQQYTAARIDPQPGAFMAMADPRTVFYFEDGRVATLRANSGRVHVPNRALESGEFSGDVVIRVYRPQPGASVDLAKDSPSVILESQKLEFDQVLGQILCDGAFRLTTDLLTFDGEGLDLLLGRDGPEGGGQSIERLTVAHPLGPIVIDRGRQRRVPVSALPSPMPTTPVQVTPMSSISWRESSSESGLIPMAGISLAAPQQSSKSVSPQPQSERFYRLELHDDVEVLRYSGLEKAWTKGDLLVAIFTLKNDLVAREMVMEVPAIPPAFATVGAAESPRRVPALSLSSHIALATIAAQSTAEPEGDLLVIRFTGPLKFEPASESDILPQRSQDMRVHIDGEEVEMANHVGLALRANDVDMDLVRDEQGHTAPKLLVATGEVEATDVAQTLWCDALHAQFESTATTPPTAAGTADDLAGDPVLGSAQATRVDAEQGVQIQLKDGARIFADGMTAFPPQGRADLRGPGLTLFRAGVAIDGMSELTVDDRKRTAHSPQGGHARSWSQPIVSPELRGKIALPVPPSSTPEMDAKWTGAMTYTDRAAAGAVLDLSQDVKIRAQPRGEEFDALDAQHVHLEMDRRQSGDGSLASAARSTTATATGGEVRPRRLIATGDARIENQLWTSAERTGEPRLFQVRGQLIDYDAVTGEASVPGAGSVLVYLPPGTASSEKAAQTRERDAHVAGGGIEGVSRFRFGGGMHLKRLVDQQYLMTMDQSVELVRAGPATEETLTLTCDRLEATLERSPTAPSSDSQQTAFNIGGSAELQRVRGIGRCFIRTPQYDIECEEFDYNTVTQIAQLRARPGRLVNVLPKGQGTPLRAAAMTWDMTTGRIQIRSGSGAVGQ
ncbi:MAG: hypothetical protein EXS15_03815 [Phycisphaerales bacterium]|nr:hypothetical protein [Phycisphaerales bacterium]